MRYTQTHAITDRQADGYTDNRTKGQTYNQTNGQMDRQTIGRKDRQTVQRTGRRINRRVNRKTDSGRHAVRLSLCLSACLPICIIVCPLSVILSVCVSHKSLSLKNVSLFARHVRLFVRPSVRPSRCSCICLSIHLYKDQRTRHVLICDSRQIFFFSYFFLDLHQLQGASNTQRHVTLYTTHSASHYTQLRFVSNISLVTHHFCFPVWRFQ